MTKLNDSVTNDIFLSNQANMTDEEVLERCKTGISLWQAAFNQQDAAGCAKQYLENATMEAKPFGVFEGREAIETFWKGIIDQGFADVDYDNVTWSKLEQGGYQLTSKWTMNKAYGVVHSEHWVIDSDGQARLIDDVFEIQGER